MIAPGGSVGEVQITYSDGAIHRGTVVGADAVTDLAVVRDDEGDDDATPVSVGDWGTCVSARAWSPSAPRSASARR